MVTDDSAKIAQAQNVNYLSRFQHKIFKNILFKKPFLSKVTILLGIIICFILTTGFLIIIRMNNNKNLKINKATVHMKPVKAVNYFSVISVSPQNNSSGNAPDTPITITFSEPVKPNSLRSYFAESPMIPGIFSQGASPNSVIFTAKFPYGEGTSVKVILNKGFESIAGHKFPIDYTYNFSTKIPDNSVVFGNNNINSRWLNLPVGTSTTFNLQLGSNVSPNSSVTIYKGTFDKIVSSLLYSNQTNQGSNYITQNYLNYPVDTSSLQQISTITNIQNGSYFTFNQDEGLYYIEAKNGDQVLGSTWVSVNDEGLIVRQDDQKVTIAAQNIKTGDINSSVKVYLWNLQDKPTLIQATQIQGFGEIPVAYPQTVDLIVGQTANGVILAPMSVPETQADIRVTDNLSNIYKIYLQTDKPTYTAQSIVKFTGIVRVNNDAQYTLPSQGTHVEIWVPDPYDSTKKLIDQTVTVGDGGIISGQFTLPSSFTPSADSTTLSATLYAAAANGTPPDSTARSYTTFDVISQQSKALIKVTFDNNTYTHDQSVVAHVSAFDESGNPMANKAITYTIYSKDYYENDPSSVANYGNDWGEQTKVVNQPTTLDGNGKVDIKIAPTDNHVSQAITLEASTTDGTNTAIYGAKTVLVQQGIIVLTFGSSRQEYHSGDTTLTRVYAQDLQGNPTANLNLNYEIYSSEYDNVLRSFKETVLSQGTATTDSNGFVLISQPIISNASNVSIRVTTKDSLGNPIQAERSMDILSSNVNSSAIYYHNPTLTNLDVATDKLSYNVGDTANLVINSPYDQNVQVTFEGGRIYHNEWLHLSRGNNNYPIQITSQLAPSFNINLSYFHNGNLYVEGLPIIVHDNSKTFTLTLTSDKNIYAKNDQAQVTITAKDNTGKPVSGKVIVNVIDDSIFNLRNNLPNSNLYWNFYSPRIDTTNFSASSLGIGTGGGCGGGSGIDITYVPNRLGNSYYMNSTFTTDQNGIVIATIPLSQVSGNLRVYVTAVSGSTAVSQSQSLLLVQ